jgi:hypothetical protein
VAITVVNSKRCGFCATNQHGRCSIGVVRHKGESQKYPNGVVWICSCEEGGCTSGRRKCAVCNNMNTEEVDPLTWTCIDVEACHATIEIKRENSPFLAQLRDIKEKVTMAKIEEGEKTKAAAKPKTGKCVHCGAETKGGSFLPGHDAAFVSGLVKDVVEAKFSKASEQTARKTLKEANASEALVRKFDKSVGLAKDKVEKAKQAAIDKEKAKAEKAKADAESKETVDA